MCCSVLFSWHSPELWVWLPGSVDASVSTESVSKFCPRLSDPISFVIKNILLFYKLFTVLNSASWSWKGKDTDSSLLYIFLQSKQDFCIFEQESKTRMTCSFTDSQVSLIPLVKRLCWAPDEALVTHSLAFNQSSTPGVSFVSVSSIDAKIHRA